MSNWKRAYGWSGHILIPHSWEDSSPDHNVISIPTLAFKAILEDMSNLRLDHRIHADRLGIEHQDNCEYEGPLACGTGFSEGYTWYGTVFLEAELRMEKDLLITDQDKEYLEAMKEIYNLDLPPCRLMVGCSSEY